MRGRVGRRQIVVFLPGTAAIGGSVTMRSIGVMMVTARCFGMLLSRGCATRPINNGMQPRRTRWKEKLPKNQQPCEVLSAMLEHALGAKEVEFFKTPSPTSDSYATSCLRSDQRQMGEERMYFLPYRFLLVDLLHFLPVRLTTV